MFEIPDRRTSLTGNQLKILAAAIIGDALEFFDYFLIGLVLAGQPSRTLYGTRHRHRGKEDSVGIGDSVDYEPRTREQGSEARPAVASQFVAQDGVIAPQHLHGGHVDQQPRTRACHTVHFADSGVFDRVRQGIQDVERTDDIKRAARERNRPDGRTGQARASGFFPERKAACGEVEAECASVVPEQFEVGAGAASAIEQQRLRNASCGLAQQRRDEQTKPIEPEMVRFGERRRAQQVIHAPDCNDLARDCIDTQQLTL